MMKGKCGVSKVVWVLVIIGAINWGLVGLGNFFGGNWDVVDLLLGGWSWLANIVYILVGVSGVYAIFGCKCKSCQAGDMKSAAPMGGMSQGM